MTEINENNCMQFIQEKLPDFAPYWEAYLKDFDIDSGLSIHMIALEEYALDKIKSGNSSSIKTLFDCVEFLVCNGNETVKNALCTAFLEDLLYKDPDEIQFVKFAQYLGKESIAYCRAWNEFAGRHTEGI